jgi:hypothetical protein
MAPRKPTAAFNLAGSFFERFLASPAKRGRGRPKDTKEQKRFRDIKKANKILRLEAEVRKRNAEVLAGEKEVPKKLADETWFPQRKLSQARVTQVLAILFETTVKTQAEDLSRAHTLYRNDALLREWLKKDGIIFPLGRPFLRKRKTKPSS